MYHVETALRVFEEYKHKGKGKEDWLHQQRRARKALEDVSEVLCVLGERWLIMSSISPRAWYFVEPRKTGLKSTRTFCEPTHDKVRHLHLYRHLSTHRRRTG